MVCRSVAPFVLLVLVITAAAGRSQQRPVEVYPRYDLVTRIQTSARRIDVSGTIRLPAVPHERREVVLYLRKEMRDFRARITAPEGVAGDLAVQPADDGANTRWTLVMKRPVPANAPATIAFEYSGSGDTQPVFHLGPRLSFAVGHTPPWYPRPMEQDDLVDGIGRLQFIVDPGLTVVATGEPVPSADGRTSFEVKAPSAFTFVAGPFSPVTAPAAGLPITTYQLGQRTDAAGQLPQVRQILEGLSRRYGPYPYPRLSIVEIPDDIAGQARFAGASLAGMILTNTSTLDEFNLAHFGHELSHQWWGNLIGTRGSDGLYLMSEGLAQLAALRTVETLDGSAAAERFRRTGYPGYFSNGTYSNQSGFGYLRHAAAGFDEPLLTLAGGPIADQMVRSKGMLVLDLLERTVGRDRFVGALRRIGADYAFKRLSWEEFAAALERHAGADLDEFFDQWIERRGVPDWTVEWRQPGKGTVQGVIVQPAPFYKVTVPVEVSAGCCSRRRIDVDLTGIRTTFSLAVPFVADRVVVDPDFTILHWTPEYRRIADAWVYATRAEMKRRLGAMPDAFKEFEEGLTRIPSPDVDGAAFELQAGWGRLFLRQGNTKEAERHFLQALESPVRTPGALAWVYSELAQLALRRQATSDFRRHASHALTADTVAGGRTGVRRVLMPLLKANAETAK